MESESEEAEEREAQLLLQTTSPQQILARLGQGKFRKSVCNVWDNKCSLTGSDDVRLLTASHIKPWRDCNDMERLDGNNGLLLIPNYDKLFDKGLMTIDHQTGTIKYSSRLLPTTHKALGLVDGGTIHLNDRQKDYMRYHNHNIFS
jgi:predicted restriction endonuclease